MEYICRENADHHLDRGQFGTTENKLRSEKIFRLARKVGLRAFSPNATLLLTHIDQLLYSLYMMIIKNEAKFILSDDSLILIIITAPSSLHQSTIIIYI